MKILYPNVPYSDIPRLVKEGKIKVGTRVKECEDPTKYPNVLDETLRTGTIGTVHGISSQKIDIIGLDEADIYFHENGFLDILEDEEEEKPIYQVGVDMGSKEGDRTVRVIVELKPLSFSEPLTNEAVEKKGNLSITFSGNSALSHLGILAMVRDVADFSKCPYIKKELDKEIKEITQSLRETNREED